jgi:ATP-binding cassette subfamily F protein uup
MVLVDLDKVTVSRPERDLFRDVSITVHDTDKVGIVGINGTGKSTLMRVIADRQDIEDGVIRRGRGVTIAMLDQNAPLPPGTVLQAVGESWQAEAVLDKLGMGGFLEVDTSELSGGEAKRVALATALLSDADLLLLDEPTNHLDIDGIEWLENFLRRRKGGLVLITHDRHLLDAICDRVLELHNGSSFRHSKGYQGYLEGRAAREANLATVERKRKNLAKVELAWLRRGAPARTTKASARVRRAEELQESLVGHDDRAEGLDFSFGTPRLGDLIIELKKASFGYAGASEDIFSDLTLLLNGHERLGIVGDNGSGKSTLLGVLAGRLELTGGKRKEGSTVRIAEFRQMGPTLDPNTRVIDAITRTGDNPHTVNLFLKRFWFDSDVQVSPVGRLSGGEQRRLQLVRTLLEQPNVLLLDEPTNDLDIETLRILEDFLETWPGCLVVVSHDRAFLERTVDDVLVVDAAHVGRYPGGYAQWDIDRKQPKTARQARKGSEVKSTTSSGGRSPSTISHHLRQAEKSLSEASQQRDVIISSMAETNDHSSLSELSQQLREADSTLATAEAVWMELSEEQEGLI